MKMIETTSRSPQSRNEARVLMEELRLSWSKAYGEDETQADIMLEIQELKSYAVQRWAEPEVPGCLECSVNSVFGGPSHRNSSFCESGRRPHCTCDMCF